MDRDLVPTNFRSIFLPRRNSFSHTSDTIVRIIVVIRSVGLQSQKEGQAGESDWSNSTASFSVLWPADFFLSNAISESNRCREKSLLFIHCSLSTECRRVTCNKQILLVERSRIRNSCPKTIETCR